MIDPIISLAFSIYSSPGVYALLLGSGTSRSAGIPTGWEVVKDLINKLAVLEDNKEPDDPVAWYTEKYQTEPDYSKLLEALAKTQEERSKLLRSYFEPTDEEREQGLKLPTTTHKAIADMVSKGYIRVIVTTNFDRLLEQALEANGITPTVISTPDAVEGVSPLAHNECTILKINGDYGDNRILNTEKELASYDDRVSTLLDRIFDDYGLIITGWSGEWDSALRTAIEKCKSHRYTFYWAAKSTLKEKARQLVQLRQGQEITTESADNFFSELRDKVFALQELDTKRHPLSVQMATVEVKRFIEGDLPIKLHDLVMGETKRLYDSLATIKADGSGEINQTHRYEAATEILQAIFIAGCRWDEGKYTDLWIRALEYIASFSKNINYESALERYPALLLLYSGGIASLAGNNFETFASLLAKTRINKNGRVRPFLSEIYPTAALSKELSGQLLKADRRYTPQSDYLCNIFRDAFRDYSPDSDEYERLFDRFEYLLSLIFLDLNCSRTDWSPVGRFLWRYNDLGPEQHIANVIRDEVDTYQVDWPFFKQDLFNGELERFKNADKRLRSRLNEYPRYYGGGNLL